MGKVLFVGTHGQRNLGDDLLMNVFMHQLRSDQHTFFVNSYDVEQTKKDLSGYKVKVFNTQTDRILLLRYLISCDALVFGGGSIIKELNEDYGGKKYETLNTIDTLTLIAKLLGKPIYFCNIGVGPINTDQGIQKAVKILRRAKHISLRDSSSNDILKRTRLTNYELSTDAVFSVEPSFFNTTAIPLNATKKKRIGINLCRNIDNDENWSYFRSELMKDLILYNKRHRDVEFIGIPMQSATATNDDLKTLNEFQADIIRSDPSIVFTVHETRSISEMASIIKACDVVIAERLHALITATIINTPTVSLAYNPKVLAIMHDIGLGNYCVNINEKFKAQSILNAMDQCLSNKTLHSKLDILYKSQYAKAQQDFNKLSNAIS